MGINIQGINFCGFMGFHYSQKLLKFIELHHVDNAINIWTNKIVLASQTMKFKP